YPSDGVIFYLPALNNAGTAPFYRLYSSLKRDHMESGTPGEGGYATEALIGYPWATDTATPGLAQICRYVDSTGDHATGRPNESSYFSGQGYNRIEAFPFWSYPRYGKASESLLSLTAGGGTIQSNAVAGSSPWTWTWNGMQFINIIDDGRQIQSAVFYNENNNQYPYNPTEAGDQYTGQVLAGQDRHGSPNVSMYNSGTSQYTQAIPLEWDPIHFGGSATTPVLYKDMMFGKKITLNFNNRGPVAEYTTYFTSPNLQKQTMLH
ncbi:MAG: hypothetical protein IVW55_16810, partial [Chloroflexi bacterium]|nr:hypothetical protein [Chloroflexota bacterium]